MKCKQCGKIFHYCSNCDFERCSFLGFCSDNCIYESDAFKETREKFDQFYKGLSIEQKRQFSDFLDYYCDYEDEIDRIVKDDLHD